MKNGGEKAQDQKCTLFKLERGVEKEARDAQSGTLENWHFAPPVVKSRLISVFCNEHSRQRFLQSVAIGFAATNRRQMPFSD